MKKIDFRIFIVVVLTAFLSLMLFAGCSAGGSAGTAESVAAPDIPEAGEIESAAEPSNGENDPAVEENNDKILIAYFSHTGNTERVANQIHENIGGDLFRITTANEYPEDYDTCVEQAKQEKKDGFRPVLTVEVENMDQYGIIFIGYPIWISTMPMALFTFLETYDLSGKTVIPFCTYGGSRFGDSLKDIKNLCPDSMILDGLAIKRDGGDSLPDDVEKWLKKIELIETE